MTVYFMRSGGYVKIGHVTNVRQRLCDIRMGSPAPVKLIATMDGGHQEERALHRRFDAHWHRGEWFRLAPEIKSFIRENARRPQREKRRRIWRKRRKPDVFRPTFWHLHYMQLVLENAGAEGLSNIRGRKLSGTPIPRNSAMLFDHEFIKPASARVGEYQVIASKRMLADLFSWPFATPKQQATISARYTLDPTSE